MGVQKFESVDSNLYNKYQANTLSINRQNRESLVKTIAAKGGVQPVHYENDTYQIDFNNTATGNVFTIHVNKAGRIYVKGELDPRAWKTLLSLIESADESPHDQF